MYHSLKEKKYTYTVKEKKKSSLAYLRGKTEQRSLKHEPVDTTSNLRVERRSGPLTSNEYKGQFFSQTIPALDYNSVLRQ